MSFLSFIIHSTTISIRTVTVNYLTNHLKCFRHFLLPIFAGPSRIEYVVVSYYSSSWKKLLLYELFRSIDEIIDNRLLIKQSILVAHPFDRQKDGGVRSTLLTLVTLQKECNVK